MNAVWQKLKNSVWRYKILLGRGYWAQSFLAGWVQTLLTCWTRAVQIARRCIGVPDYDTYLHHLREHHPDRVPMSYPEFFTERQNARYKGGGGRCC